MSLKKLQNNVRELANPGKARILQGFFKTGPGEYGEGDVFLGITVPQIRRIARANRNCDLAAICALIRSKYHEERLLALLLLVQAYAAADDKGREMIYRIYLQNTRYINNWDLVDLSAPRIVGFHLIGKSTEELKLLAGSKSLWERRIAIVATAWFINNGKFDDTLAIAKMLIEDPEDLIHKATGWMLREVGKRNMNIEEAFVRQHCLRMPRTMLRYAIERFPEKKRLAYLRMRSTE